MRHVIFDFDGTIANSLPLVIDIAKTLLPNVDLSDRRIDHLRNLAPKQAVKESGLSYLQIPRLLIKGKVMLSKRLDEVPITPDLEEVIKHIYDRKHKLYVVSSNSEINIRLFLDKYKIKRYFSAIYGNVGLFSKAQTLKRVLKKQQLPPDSCLYIGDEVRNIEAAKKISIPVIVVTWGFNGKKILHKYRPDYIANTPADLIKIIETDAA